MPARVSRTSVSAPGPKSTKKPKNKNKKRSLDAYSQAQRLVPEAKIARHRLGEIEDDGPRHKRRRNEDAEDEEESDEEEPQRKKPTQRRGSGQDDGVEFGSDSEGNEWTMGGMAEDDDDSDLDSDEAFGESDEERFEGFTFRGSSKSKSKKKAPKRRDKGGDVDLDEQPESADDSGDSQDEEGLGLGDDAVDLAAMLDDNDEDDAADEEDGSESDEGDDEDESEEDDDSEDEIDESGTARLQDFVEGLDAGSSKNNSDIPQRATADLDDFMEGMDFAAEKSFSKSKRKKANVGPVAAPLPKRQQDRLDREVAARKAKEQLDRWRDTVVRNRRAEHLSFPMQNPGDQGVTVGREKFLPASQQAPANELEESIRRIMQESGLQAKDNGQSNDVEDEEAALIKAEGLAEKHLPVEEVMRRRAELRKTRELLFREEIKAKRVAKIKSKSYRRVHRKERERLAEQERQALEGLGLDPDEDEKEKHDRQRAEARMSTKHRDSKWAKSLKQTNRSAWDDDARDGVIEQARRNEELKKRIAGRDVSGDEGSELTSDDDDEITIQQLQAMKDDAGEKKGLAGLKFMRDAEERKRKANNEDIERLRKELAVADGEEVESDVEEESLGRAIFGPAAKDSKRPVKQKKPEFEAPAGSDEDEDGDEQEAESTAVTEKSNQQNTRAGPKGILKKKTVTASGPLAKGMTEANDEPTSTTNGWLRAPKNKSKKGREVDVEVNIDTTAPNVKQPKSKPSQEIVKQSTSNGTAGNTDGWTTVSYTNGGASDSEADEPSNAILSAQEQKQTLQQRAFAGDDVAAAFEAEKNDLAASEDEKEVSNHLPGWGSWTGDGLSRSIKKANKRAAHNPLYKTKLAGVRREDRKDTKLENVIVSERQDRKGKKYLAPTLPHEFETKEQYERSRRLPMGPEWTTKEVHQRMTKPRVIVKPGVRIEALERPTV